MKVPPSTDESLAAALDLARSDPHMARSLMWAFDRGGECRGAAWRSRWCQDGRLTADGWRLANDLMALDPPELQQI